MRSVTGNVLISQADGILEIRLNRPEKKNALTAEMYGVAAGAVESAGEDDAVRAILLSAEGDMFTAGNDLADFMRAGAEGAADVLGNVVRFLRAFVLTEKPVVAAVSGDGVGIGATILLHCDLVVIADQARLTTPFTGLGLTPEAASSLLLPELMGHRRAYRMLALGEPMGEAEAVACGLANEAAPAGEVRVRARKLAEACAARPPEAMRITKRLLRNRDAILACIDEENRHFMERLASPEARAAFEAFFSR